MPLVIHMITETNFFFFVDFGGNENLNWKCKGKKKKIIMYNNKAFSTHQFGVAFAKICFYFIFTKFLFFADKKVCFGC